MTRIITNVKSFLLENRTTKQTLFKNTSWIVLSTAVGRVLGTIWVIYITRILGAVEYGKLAFALAFVSLFVSFLDLGLSTIVTREFSRDREREKEFPAIFTLKILLGLGTAVLIFIASFFVTDNPEIQRIIWILAFFTFISQFPETFYAFFWAREKMEYASLANIFQVLLITGCGFLVIFRFPSVKNISYSYLFASLIALIPLLILFHFKFFPLKISFQVNIWKKFLKMSWPLALTSIFGVIYGYIDSTIMGFLGQITQIGWYNAALKIASFLASPASIIALSFFPVLGKFSKKSKEEFQKVWNRQTEIMIFLAFPAVVGGFVLAPKIINFIYGSDYNPSILAFQILIFMAGINFLNRSFSQVLIVADQQRKIFLVTVSGALINIVLNLILIPKYSLYGAAAAAVITHFLMFFLYFIFTAKFTLIRPLNLEIFLISLKAILAAGVMYFIISWPQIYYLNVFLSVLIGGTVYIITFFVLKSLLNYSFNRLIIKKNP